MKIKNFFNFLYPEGYKCIICDKEISDNKFEICEHCFSALPKISGNTCNKCGEPINNDSFYCLHCKNDMPKFTKCVSPFLFEAEITKLIHEFKYDNKTYLAKALGKLMVKHYINCNLNCDVVVPVPLSFNRINYRGYNQAVLLCHEFVNIGLKVENNCVVRNKDTLTQTSLTKKQRKDNMENAFTCINKSAIKNKNVLVVDDVYTTGATISALSEVLLSAGAKSVYGITFAHTIINK